MDWSFILEFTKLFKKKWKSERNLLEMLWASNYIPDGFTVCKRNPEREE